MAILQLWAANQGIVLGNQLTERRSWAETAPQFMDLGLECVVAVFHGVH